MKEAKKYLNTYGKILMSFSSLSGDIEFLMKHYEYRFEKLAEKRIFFEVLYVYLLK